MSKYRFCEINTETHAHAVFFGEAYDPIVILIPGPKGRFLWLKPFDKDYILPFDFAKNIYQAASRAEALYFDDHKDE